MIAASRYFTQPIETVTCDSEDAFFVGIRLANKTFKTTASRRTPELDAVIVKLARDRGSQNLAVLDVSVSSGATAMELLEAMTAGDLQPAITATDLAVKERYSPSRPAFACWRIADVIRCNTRSAGWASAPGTNASITSRATACSPGLRKA